MGRPERSDVCNFHSLFGFSFRYDPCVLMVGCVISSSIIGVSSSIFASSKSHQLGSSRNVSWKATSGTDSSAKSCLKNSIASGTSSCLVIGKFKVFAGFFVLSAV
ncbi:25003_t:CDS:2 [Gigaspora rosea]|nr:25003_t:CDS:2 [Gigaspora rosea]